MFRSCLLLVVCLAWGQSVRAATLTSGYTIGSGLLGNSLIIDNANTGGADSSSSTGDLGWTAELGGLWRTNSTVILSGIALPIWSNSSTNNTTVSGTFTFYFYDLDRGTNANAFDGTSAENLVGTATASFSQGAVGTYYAVFDSPIKFTAHSTGVAVRIVNNGWLRLKVTTAALAPGVVLKNSANGSPVNIVSGSTTNTNFRISIAGLAFTPSAFAPRVNLAKYQTVIADSTSGQRLASYVTDGVAGNDNRWQSDNSGPHWAEVVFPFPVQVGSAQVFSGIDDGSALTGFTLQYLTNSTWVNVPGASVSGNANVENDLVFSAPVTATAFRIYDSADKTVNLKELALYPPNGAGEFPVGTDLTLDLARERPALATANTTGNFAENAVDGYVGESAMWQTSLAGSNSLMIDLRVNSKIGSAHLYSGSDGVSPLANFVLRYWNGSAWQNIPGGGVSGNTNPVCVVPFAAGVVTSNVLLVFTNTSVTSIKELCIFPANNNGGYAVGTGVISGPPSTARFDDYNDAYYNLSNAVAASVIVDSNGVPVQGTVPAYTWATQTNGWSGQYQVLLNLSTGTYRLCNRATGYCLSGAQLSTNAGALLVDEPYSALPDQDWILQPVDGQNFVLVNQWSGLALDTQGGGTAPGTPLVQNLNTGAASQRWHLMYATNFPKKGLGGTGKLSDMAPNWVYDWGLTTSASLPFGTIFAPMQWGNFNWDIGSNQGPNWQYYPAWRTTAGGLHLLGFNEPDNTPQSNIDPTNAALLWPRLQAMDVPLAGPVCANVNGSWNPIFFGYVANRGLRVDYLPAHEYVAPAAGSSSCWVNPLQTAYNTYGLPIWMTEFGNVDWAGNQSWTEEDNYNALAEFLWRAESISWLRKYALFVFTADTNNPIAPNPWTATTPAPRSNAYDTNGNLTPFGQLYAAWDDDANVETNKVYFIHNDNTRKRLQNTLGSTADATDIRTNDATVQWVLTPAGGSGLYYLASQLDGRRLGFVNGGSVNLVAPDTTGSTVQWGLTQYQYGWFYLEHPATGKRLKLSYNNSTLIATFSMVTNTTTGNAVLWRFIVPLNPVPPAPFGLMAVGGTSQIALNWNYGNASGMTYRVYRSTNSGGSYSLVASNLSSASYLDTTVLTGTNYYYVVTAENASTNESPYSNEASAVASTSLPTAPTNLTYTISNSTLTLSWPTNYIGWLLQMQTNSLEAGPGTNWVTVPESGTNSVFSVPINPAVPTIFYRLMRP